MKIKRALEEVGAEAQKDGDGFEYMRNIRDGSLEMRIFKGTIWRKGDFTRQGSGRA